MVSHTQVMHSVFQEELSVEGEEVSIVQPPVGAEIDDWQDEWATFVTEKPTTPELPFNDSEEDAEGFGDGPPGSCLAEDEMLDSEQVEALIQRLLVELGEDAGGNDQSTGEKQHRRKKRKVLKDFKINRWEKTIPYMIDGDFGEFYHIISGDLLS